jgi:hypothetical protein
MAQTLNLSQAHEYEQAQGKELQQFFDSTAGKFKTETGWVGSVGRLVGGAVGRFGWLLGELGGLYATYLNAPLAQRQRSAGRRGQQSWLQGGRRLGSSTETGEKNAKLIAHLASAST